MVVRQHCITMTSSRRQPYCVYMYPFETPNEANRVDLCENERVAIQYTPRTVVPVSKQAYKGNEGSSTVDKVLR